MDSVTISIEDALQLLKGGTEGVAEWNQRRSSGASPVDLSGLDLEGANLEKADLTHLNLSNSNFSGANLKRAQFCHADLTGADLTDANLTKCNLSHADLTGATLVGVTLDGADLQETRFIESDLEGTSFKKARFRSTVIAADLSNVKLESLDEAKHQASSHVTFGSVRGFNGNLPKRFLKGCQLDDRIIKLFAQMSAESNDERGTDSARTVKIFLASSEELREDRDAFDLHIREQNDEFREEGLYLEIVRWENFLDVMSEAGLQEEYNKKVRECDIFVSLFMTKTGRFTEEEFDVAHQAFLKKGKPRIYTLFKDIDGRLSELDRDSLMSLWDFQDKLKQLKHYYKTYKNTDELKGYFSGQLRKLKKEERI